ncbi:hypothetical protein NPIL_136781 [Nephila pilipes]|uniref:Uncharacterized protein n=1 Tax=Nephila pilipes TaxID=299642 RepID=A0A8X6TS22_NEPPI|nr:hypothetical protein NPIL_136781 [Nephila pilipes]
MNGTSLQDQGEELSRWVRSDPFKLESPEGSIDQIDFLGKEGASRQPTENGWTNDKVRAANKQLGKPVPGRIVEEGVGLEFCGVIVERMLKITNRI